MTIPMKIVSIVSNLCKMKLCLLENCETLMIIGIHTDLFMSM